MCQAREEGSVYLWHKQNGNISSSATGVNSSILSLVNLQLSDAGNYRCEVTTDCGASYSNYGTITVIGKKMILHIIYLSKHTLLSLVDLILIVSF